MRIARTAVMQNPTQQHGGSRSHWALLPRARGAIVVLLSTAACSGSARANGGDMNNDNGSASPDGGSPGDAGVPDAGVGAQAGALVTVAADGPGRITSTPAGIDCGAGGTVCTAHFAAGSVVLTTDDATTVRWSGACSGNGTCALPVGADRSVTASVTAETFAPLRRTFDGSDHGSDACNAIAAGPGDSIVVAGSVQRFSQGDDAWAGAFDAAGNLVWHYELNTPSEGHDTAASVVALPDGGALVAGTWFSGSNSHWNSFAFGASATGAIVWSQLDEIVGDDMYQAIARAPGGRLFVAGARPDAAGQTQAWLRALTPDGSGELWAVTRDGSAPGADSASGVAVDAAGDVIASGTTINAGTGSDGWLAKYSPDGAVRWSISLASPGSGADSIRKVATAPDGSIAAVATVGGASSIRVYTAAGAPRWDITSADGSFWAGVAVDPAGNVAVTGTTGSDLVVRKYSPAGALLWQRTIAGARGQAVAIDAHGGVLVCGAVTVAGNTDGLILDFLQ
jgi:hypothetical protein